MQCGQSEAPEGSAGAAAGAPTHAGGVTCGVGWCRHFTQSASMPWLARAGGVPADREDQNDASLLSRCGLRTLTQSEARMLGTFTCP